MTTTHDPMPDEFYAGAFVPMTPDDEAYCAAQEARGELAFAPETLTCYQCTGGDGVGIQVAVRALGPIVDRADPTQTYELACGHTAI